MQSVFFIDLCDFIPFSVILLEKSVSIRLTRIREGSNICKKYQESDTMKDNQPYPLYQMYEITDLKDLIDRQVKIHPQAPAFQWKSHKDINTKTRTEFQQDIKASINWFKHHNIHHETIAIIASNSYAYLVLFFGIVLSGNIAAPIDKEASLEDMHYMLALSDTDKVFYEEEKEWPQGIEAFSVSTLDEMIREGKNDPDTYDAIEIDPETVCAYFFTSGTTGHPKAVMLTHKNLATDINKACKNFVLTGDTVSVLPFHHCFGLITAIFKVFNYGKKTYINTSLRRVQKTLQEQKPQTIFLVPLFVETFHKRIWTEIRKEHPEEKVRKMMQHSEQLLKVGIDVRKKMFKGIQDVFGGNLQYIICGGAFLDNSYIEDFHAWGITILNGYGITECSPVVAVNRNHFIKKGSVGQVLEGVQVRINENDEVCIKSDIVMKGYYGNEEETEKVLQDGWFNTQDIGYLDEDNFLFLNGRKKNLIILSNGENVSPEQIEMNLSKHEEIEEIVVYARNNQLWAAIYPQNQEEKTGKEIDRIIQKYNEDNPMAKRIVHYRLRSTPFEKTPTKKIIRSKAIGEEQ